ncbi:conserved hypothetical protein [Microbacterium sp. 8M]|uniref:hypothetical protein n=1 Tax=Microbacterium sp. 8M TaxID=2653153 RepID=UPI0012EF5A28|nr:hypothetical protein [Microbacterium sp. 8M]VXB73763.1 conserved hypothetical protein [Microbacterium sp. 8M]
MTQGHGIDIPEFVVDNASEPRGVSRRTLVRGAAWSVPVIAVAAATPLAAASVVTPCAEIPAESTWITQSPVSGGLTGAANLNGWGGTGLQPQQSNVFVSLRDNASTTSPVTVRTSTTITIGKPNTTVTFVLNGLAQHGGLQQQPVPTRASTVQFVDIAIDGNLVAKFSTYADQTPGATQLPIRTATNSYPWGTYNFSYFFPTAGTHTLTYDFHLPAATPTSQDDIFLTSPRVASCSAT